MCLSIHLDNGAWKVLLKLVHFCFFFRRILLDSGDGNVTQYIKNLKQVLHEENCDIEHLLVSHWHHDHIGGVPDILKITPGKI